MKPSVLELCAGGGGQALGLEWAGFDCIGAVEIEERACDTLRHNRPKWKVIQGDIRELSVSQFKGVDFVAGGVPCPPFSIAGKQLGADDERDLFPTALEIIEKVKPNAVLLENVAGFASAKFEPYRRELITKLGSLGYESQWRVLNASDYGVPQLRPRFILVALKSHYFNFFEWPEPVGETKTVGEVLQGLMSENDWPGSRKWADKASKIAPTLVGGSKKHGGPDLGPTRAKKQWRELGVDGMGLADAAPERMFPVNGMPRLTVRMVAKLQSFPDSWVFTGKKTAAYRQVGNAFPPLVAEAVGISILNALNKRYPGLSMSQRNGYTPRLLEKAKVWKTSPLNEKAQKR